MTFQAIVNGVRAGARFCQRTIGWNRLALALSLCIIGIAIVVLHRMLQGIDIDDVFYAIRTTPWPDIALAALFVAAAYGTLTFYDFFALRQIGRKNVPYRIAALGGFTSYSVGHNVGATVFTGGAVRYRIYSAHGLDAVDVAKICFLAGLTFWLGNATVLGLGILIDPEAASLIDRLPPAVNRIIAIVVLVVLAAYVAWVATGARAMGRGGWRVRLPNGRSTLVQIGIGIVDLTCCALAMYALMPATPEIGFLTLAVIFVSATLLGFASHAPGGIGVFDAAMLLALTAFDREELLASLLLFRLLYYIVPFTLALLVLGVRELAGAVGNRRFAVLPTIDAAGPLKSEIDRRRRG
ncbi:MAG: UPF0104 family protein [Burkholderiales bacterium]|nr:UPF0104 family protein [Burkholderiales bacterium]